MPNQNKTNVIYIPSPKTLKLRYCILPGNFHPGFEKTDLYNRIFEYWYSFWEDVLRKNGSSSKVDPHDFLRADYIGALLYDDEKIAGLIIQNFINFERKSNQHHPYLSAPYSDLFVEYAKRNATRSALTVETATVDPEWRKDKTGVSLGAVLLGTSFMMQQNVGAEVGLIRARQDVKISDAITSFGGVTLQADIDMHKTPVSFMVMPQERFKSHEDERVQSLLERLWKKRTDYSQISKNDTKRSIAY